MKNIIHIVLIFLVVAANAQLPKKNVKMKEEIATLGGGCFWCTEAIFEELEGVNAVLSGYSGGSVVNPSYKEVCTGATGHAEVIRIHFDPSKIGFDEILEVFFKTHDPTTLNRQGADVGTQYRSVIFYHSENQKKIALQKIEDLSKLNVFKEPIITSVEEFKNFYQAEDYHQDYFKNHPDQTYCAFVIKPKVNKFRKDYSSRLKNL